MVRTRVLALASALVAVAAPTALAAPTPSGGGRHSRAVVDGHARFEVLSPTLVRMEYAGDGRFEDRPTFNAVHRGGPVPRYTVRREGGTLTIRTDRLTVRYLRGSGPFTPANLSVRLRVGGTLVTARPDWLAAARQSMQAEAPGALSGWRRGLDGQAGPAPMAPGLLRRRGWYLLVDTTTALYDGPGRTTPRPGHGGQPYQDGYFFGYGHDYVRGLRDLHDLTGPSALLPRWAYGVWFSRYFPYTATDYSRHLLPQFRVARVPLDALVVDTDWKAPYAWNGWEWNRSLFPDPTAFTRWAHRQGLALVFNVHPSIDGSDPRFDAAQRDAKGRLRPGLCMTQRPSCYVFDFADPKQVKAYFDLHAPFEHAGVDAWWLDWCCDGSSSSAAGLTPDSWVNSLYALDGDRRGRRGFAFSRIGSAYTLYTAALTGYPTGAWAEHRYTLHFTGDTASTWPMLAFEAEFTAREGAGIGLSNVTHDIGGFYTAHPADDLYARWVQLGAFQPVLRLHSDGGDRLPWQYGAAADRSATRFLRLREALLPYTYTTARQAHDTGVPIVRPLWLQWPKQPAAYHHPTEYLYGPQMLVAPVTSPGERVTTDVWFPPGRWTDYFTGRTYLGPGLQPVTSTLDTMPVFLRAGGVVPERSWYVDHDAGHPLSAVTLDVAAGTGGGTLYEDVGTGHGYAHGAFARTAFTTVAARCGQTVRIGTSSGRFPGQLRQRTWTLRLLDAQRPAAVAVDGRPVRWTYREADRSVVAALGRHATASGVTVTVRWAGCAS